MAASGWSWAGASSGPCWRRSCCGRAGWCRSTGSIDDLWPEDPPARAAATVQVFVSNLRRALEPDRARGAPGTVLVTASRGLPAVDRARRPSTRTSSSALAERGRAALERRRPRAGRRAAAPRVGAVARPGARRPAGRAVRPGRGRPVGGAAAGRRRGPHRRRARAGPAQRAGGRAGTTGAAAPDAGAVAGPADARALPVRAAGRRAAGVPGGAAGAATTSWGWSRAPGCGSWSRRCCATIPTWPGSRRPR